jgi:integrase
MLSCGLDIFDSHPGYKRLIDGIQNEQVAAGCRPKQREPFLASMLAEAEVSFFAADWDSNFHIQLRLALWLAVEFGLRVGEVAPVLKATTGLA